MKLKMVLILAFAFLLSACAANKSEPFEPSSEAVASQEAAPTVEPTIETVPASNLKPAASVKPAPEPPPSIAKFVERMQWFDEVEDDKDGTRAQKREYERRRAALVAALEYKLRRNPLGRSDGTGDYYTSGYEPSVYLEKYQGIVPRSLLLQALITEAKDLQRTLNRAYGNELYFARQNLRNLRNAWQLTRQEMTNLGFTTQQLLEAEVNFKGTRDDIEPAP